MLKDIILHITGVPWFFRSLKEEYISQFSSFMLFMELLSKMKYFHFETFKNTKDNTRKRINKREREREEKVPHLFKLLT